MNVTKNVCNKYKESIAIFNFVLFLARQSRIELYHIVGVMVDLEYGRSWVEVNPKTITLVLATSLLSMHHIWSESKTGWL
jgi:hypothetical protein